MNLADLLAPRPAPDLPIALVTADSRAVGPGALFVAIPGAVADGRAFIPDAVARGAVAVLAPPGTQVPPGVALIEDPSPRRALARIARRLHPRQPEVLVAVTGTNGKSSTVEFLRQIWALGGRSSAAVGTLGVRIGAETLSTGLTTPDPIAVHRTLDELSGRGVTHVAMEASSHGLDQDRLAEVEITASAFTNLSQDHLDYHGDMESYFRAKLRLFTELTPKGRPCVIMVDGDWGRRCAEAARAAGRQVVSIGWSGADVDILEVMPRAASQRLELKVGHDYIDVEAPLVGEFQALNAVQAAALAVATGLEPREAFGRIAQLRPVRGRLERAGATSAGAPVFVDYAHTPDGLDQLLRAVRPHTAGRVICVFGCGGDRDKTKRAPMGAKAARFADVVIVTDDNPRTEDPAAIRAQVLAAAPDAKDIPDRAEAIRTAVGMLGPGDALVIAGKGHETGQILADRTIPFDDVEVARACLGLPALGPGARP